MTKNAVTLPKDTSREKFTTIEVYDFGAQPPSL